MTTEKDLSAPGSLAQHQAVTESNRAVFLDRDGTLNIEKEYLSDPDQLELFSCVPEALRKLSEAGFLLIVVTNQSGIGRGYYTEDDMHRVNERLETLLATHGVAIEKIYFAPESPEEPSRGRKPSPQFLLDAQEAFGIDLGASFMVGDKISDIECGWNAKVRKSILVRTGYGAKTENNSSSLLGDAMVVDDLREAVDYILARKG